MKYFPIVLLLLILFSSCKTTRRYTAPATSTTRTEYINTFSDIAIREMKRTGIPASIKMAQAILESGDGNSTLARQANNHFGIKCHDWTGRRIYHDDDEANECFRRYNNPKESFVDHSEFLTGRGRYAALFQLEPHDYRAWARGLKASGYATNPNYDRLLIRIIEDNSLYKLDTGAAPSFPSRTVSETVLHSGSRSPVEAGRQISRNNRIRYIIAKAGDTYESLTTEMELMRWELARYNDFPDNHTIRPGDIVYLQPKRHRAERGYETHIVKEGETMHQISQKYGVRLDRLLRRNHMERGKEPEPGRVILLRGQTYQDNSWGFMPEYEF